MGKRALVLVVATLVVATVGFGMTTAAAAGKPGGGGGCPASKPGCAPAPTYLEGPCVVWLHGQGADGQATTSSGGVTYVYPRGNAQNYVNGSPSGWKWLYFGTAGEWDAAVQSVRSAVVGAGCKHVVIDGFSNGAAFAGKLFCNSPDLGATVVGYVVDDPVTDHGVDTCPAPGARVLMYWTGALDYSEPPFSCTAANNWTCEGGSTVGADEYAQNLGLGSGGWTQSPNRRHKPYTWPPKVYDWLRGVS